MQSCDFQLCYVGFNSMQIWLYFFNHFQVCFWDSMWGVSVWNWWRIVKNKATLDLLTTCSQVDNPQKVTWEAQVGSWSVKCQKAFHDSSHNFANSQDDPRDELPPYFVCFPYFFTYTIKAHEIERRILERKSSTSTSLIPYPLRVF